MSPQGSDTTQNSSVMSETACVLEVPFSQICEAPISLAKVPQCRYRFLDCRSFARRESLRVVHSLEIPAQQYAAISYVWRGLKPRGDAGASGRWMTVHGAQGADPISADVLRLACVASLDLGCEMLWLDGLCVMQSDAEDKAWQIENMYDIYKSCKECIVIPGGLSRLATLFEETFWVHRAWTLQEAIAPPSAQCLFAWARGNCVFQSNFPLFIREVEAGTAAMASLEGLLQMSFKGGYMIEKFDGNRKKSSKRSDDSIAIFGAQFSQLSALIGALDMKGHEGMANAVWRSSFMRSAKYPVDLVFSIMGLMGATLDTTEFALDDRLGATIALMREMLKQGRRAEWLGLATQLDINPDLSTIPVFPRPNASGKAIVATQDGVKEVSKLMDGWWMIADTPTGMLDDEGYLKFQALGAPVSQVQDDEPGTTFSSVHGIKWKVSDAQSSRLYAVFIGEKEFYTNGSMGAMIDSKSTVLMLVQEHASGRFHAIGYAFIVKQILDAKGWEKREFQVGGRGLGLLT